MNAPCPNCGEIVFDKVDWYAKHRAVGWHDRDEYWLCRKRTSPLLEIARLNAPQQQIQAEPNDPARN